MTVGLYSLIDNTSVTVLQVTICLIFTTCKPSWNENPAAVNKKQLELRWKKCSSKSVLIILLVHLFACYVHSHTAPPYVRYSSTLALNQVGHSKTSSHSQMKLFFTHLLNQMRYFFYIDIAFSDQLMCLKCTFSFLSRGIILWFKLPWPENPVNIRKNWTAISALLGLISCIYRDVYLWK